MLAMRRGHRFASDPSLSHYCSASHLVVSLEGDPRGFVDEILARRKLARRVALTVPNCMFALALLRETDLICAVPRRFAAAYAALFGVMAIDAPLPLGQFRLNIVVPKVAMLDAGVAWLTGCSTKQARKRSTRSDPVRKSATGGAKLGTGCASACAGAASTYSTDAFAASRDALHFGVPG